MMLQTIYVVLRPLNSRNLRRVLKLIETVTLLARSDIYFKLKGKFELGANEDALFHYR